MIGTYFIRRPVFAVALAIAMTLLGGVSLTRLSIEQYPDITPPVVEVSATYTGADAQTVNNSVAVPVAQQVMGVSDMLYMQATSANDGTMSLQVTFDIGSSPDMDAIFTQNNVSSAVANLPEAVSQQGLITRKSNTGFLMVYSLMSDGRYDDEFLSNYAYLNLESRIEKINGVGKVSIMGAGEYAMRIWIRPQSLHYYGLELEEVIDAIRTQSAIYPVGRFGAEPAPEQTVYTYTATLPPPYSTAEEFSSIILSLDEDGNEVRLSDVASVELGSQTYDVRSSVGGNPSTMIVIYQEPGSNAVEVGAKVKEQIAQIEERLPDGVTLHTVVDSTTAIEAGIDDIVRTLLLALLLVIVIIYLFLQDWRATLIPLVAIPVSLVGVFALFPLLGFSLNIISLLGLVLAIGLVVDDAIVVVEAVQVNIEQGKPPHEATAEAMRRVASPIVATTVVLLAVFVPVSFTSGITGLLFRQFSITLAAAITLSAFNALTLSPALCAMLLRRREKHRQGFFARFNGWVGRLTERYDALSSTLVRHTLRTAIFIGATMLVTIPLWRALPSGFLPEEDQGYLMVTVTTPEASSLGVTERAMRHIEQVVSARSEVAFTSMATGFNMIAGISSPSSGIIFVVLKDYSERRLSASQIAQELTEELYVAVPEAEAYAFIPPSIPGLGITSGVTLQVQDLEGRGTAYLNEQTSRLIDSLRRESSIASVSTPFSASTPQQMIFVDRHHAMSQRVSLGSIYSALGSYLGGTYIGNFNRFGRLYQSYLQAAPESRASTRSIDSYFVENSSGESVPLSAFVSVRDTVGVEYLTQFNLYESIPLTVTPAAKASTGDVMQAIERVAEATLPDDVGYAWSGMSYQEANAASGGWAVYVLALVFVFLALAALYESWSLPLAILMSVPVAVVGALASVALAHLLDAQIVNNIYTQISLVMLIGLAAKNAILVVEYAHTRLLSSKEITLLEATIGAARERLRPILMTALAFILGVMPLVFASGNFSTARNIMGVALVGGMVVGTVVGIFVYPAAYYLVARIGRFEHRRNEKLS